jgi:hypothetical protein
VSNNGHDAAHRSAQSSSEVSQMLHETSRGM